MAGPAGSVVLMSGGIESAALLYHWRSSSALLHPLYINYGQRGAAMEEQASDKLCTGLGLQLSRIDMSVVGEQFRALQKQARAFVPLPHRNLVILGLAASFATQVGSVELALGLNKEDLGSYSSASQPFLDSFRSTAASLQPPVAVLTPLSHLTKAEVISFGKSLGVPFADTYSCMVGRPIHCGRCHQIAATGFCIGVRAGASRILREVTLKGSAHFKATEDLGTEGATVSFVELCSQHPLHMRNPWKCLEILAPKRGKQLVNF